LSRVGIVNIENLNDVLPGLRVQNIEGGAINIALRGIGTNQNTELGDPNVATHFDDVYIPRVRGLNNSFFDLRSVEVNFGPQGTLRGRNASSGSLNFIANTPGLKSFDGMVEAGYGNYDQVTVRGILNVPLITDVLGCASRQVSTSTTRTTTMSAASRSRGALRRQQSWRACAAALRTVTILQHPARC
jgi:iron complex outermembrane receptor protein